MCRTTLNSTVECTEKTTTASLSVKVKGEVTFRLQRIDIKRSDAIDQIRFTYDDGTTLASGHDGGKADNRPVIMTEGESIVRVTHEEFVNYKAAGAAVEFETNKGRVFSFEPMAFTTKLGKERTTVEAEPGMEIIALLIRKGTLIGTEQQLMSGATAAVPKSSSWFVVASLRMKEDGGDDFRLDHFEKKSDALKAWRNSECEVNERLPGRAAILTDAMALKVLKRAGRDGTLAACITKAIDAGVCAEDRDEDVKILAAIMVLFKILSQKSDIFMFAVIMVLLGVSHFFDLEAKLLTGQVVTMTMGDSGQLDQLKNNFYVMKTCSIVGCDGSAIGYQKALILSFIVVMFLERMLYVLNVYFHHNACDSKNKLLRAEAFKHVLSLDQAFFDTHSTSEIRGSMNVHAINNMITWNIPYIVNLILQLVMVGWYLCRMNMQLGLIALISMFLIKFGIMDQLSKVEKTHGKIQRKLDTLNNQIIDETFGMMTSGMPKLFTKEAHHIAEQDACADRYVKNLNAVVTHRCLREFLWGFLRTLVFGAVLYLGLNAGASLKPAEATGFFLLLQSMQSLVGRIEWHWNVLVREFPDIDRFLKLMENKPAILPGEAKIECIDDAIIEFHDVVFEYPSRPGEEVLKGLDLQIQPKKMTAVVGDSGSGKSTITKLITRLYDPKAGTICIGGKHLKDMDLEHLRSQIGVVQQNPDLYNATLAENIAYGSNEKVDDKAVGKAASLSRCDFIRKFRAGLDTFAGGHGTQLSGGQKQRIAIARGCIRDPKILILDEATSALDAENEQLVQAEIEKAMQGRTTIVIAHRLSTIKNADEIICMKDGEVVERGTHIDLLARQGCYANLVRKQLFEEQKKAEVPELENKTQNVVA